MESAKHPVFDGIKKELAEAKNRIKELENAVYEMYWELDANGNQVEEYTQEQVDNLLNKGE